MTNPAHSFHLALMLHAARTSLTSAQPPRSIGEVVTCHGASGLVDLRQSGAMKAVFPRPNGNAAEVVLINTSGGVTSGDSLRVSAEARAGADVTLTTQAAERAYRATDGYGHVKTRLLVDDQARISWLPQETILFEGSALHRRLRADLHGSGRLLVCEPLVFGRKAMHETLDAVQFDDRLEIWRDGAPLYLDGACLADARPLAGPATAAGAGAAAQVVLVDPQAEALLPAVRDCLSPTGGASLMSTDVLVVRMLADDSFVLRKSLLPILECLSGRPLPASWRL